MPETLPVINERVDAMPWLLAQLEGMDVPAVLDEYFPPHGKWTGLRLGGGAGVWLAHILSEADQRLHHVQTWAARRLDTRHRGTGLPAGARDCSDERLAHGLRSLSEDGAWRAFESRLTQPLLRVYALRVERVRLDRTSASGYGAVPPEGLFPVGPSQERRPDLPPVTVLLATLAPLGLPIAPDVLPGPRAAAPLYRPAIARVRERLRSPGLLYVGDCQMAAVETRACLQAGGACSLCPVSPRQRPAAVLQASLAPVWAGAQAWTWITRERAEGPRERLAEGYERVATQTAVSAGQPRTWPERRLVVRSLHQGQAGAAALRARLAQAQAGGAAPNERGRGKARFTAVEPLCQAGAAVWQRYRVHGLLRVDDEEHSQERRVRGYRGRPARGRVEHAVPVNTPGDEAALEAAVRRLGWRGSATKQPAAHLSLSQAVLAYRSE